MKYELKQISLWPFVKIAFVVNLLAGALGGMFALPFMAMVVFAMNAAEYGYPDMYDGGDSAFGGLVILLPVIMGLGAAVVGTTVQSVAVLIYNLLARLFGGFEFTLREVGGQVVPVADQKAPHSFPPPPRPQSPAPSPPPPPSPTAAPPMYTPPPPPPRDDTTTDRTEPHD